MRFNLTLSLDNDDAHMGGPDALAGYLRDVASRVQAGYGNGTVRDLNGVTIGSYAITDERPACPACGSTEPDCEPGCPAVPAREHFREPAHCRHHIEFRSDCDQCVTERTYES